MEKVESGEIEERKTLNFRKFEIVLKNFRCELGLRKEKPLYKREIEFEQE